MRLLLRPEIVFAFVCESVIRSPRSSFPVSIAVAGKQRLLVLLLETFRVLPASTLALLTPLEQLWICTPTTDFHIHGIGTQWSIGLIFESTRSTFFCSQIFCSCIPLR